MDGAGGDGGIKAGGWPVEQAIAKDEAGEGRGGDVALQAEDALHGSAVDGVGDREQAIRFAVGFWALIIDERDALGDEAAGSGVNGGVDEIAGAGVAQRGIACERGGHLAGLQGVGEVRELVDDDIGADGGKMATQGFGIEDVNDDRLDTGVFQSGGLIRESSGAEDAPTVLQEKRSESASDGTGRTGEEDPSDHD